MGVSRTIFTDNKFLTKYERAAQLPIFIKDVCGGDAVYGLKLCFWRFRYLY